MNDLQEALDNLSYLVPHDGFNKNYPIILVCHQHLLPSSLPLFKYISEYITLPKSVFVLGKPYSTIDSCLPYLKRLGVNLVENTFEQNSGGYKAMILKSINALWENVLSFQKNIDNAKLIVLDEGGYLRKTIPDSIRSHTIVVEQTTSGIHGGDFNVPTINVAQSFAKQQYETPNIAEAIVCRLKQENLLLPNVKIGILGMGVIGTAIAKLLQKLNVKTYCYDIDQHKYAELTNSVIPVDSQKQLVDIANIVIGCTGTNSLKLESVNETEICLISASSGDVEFSEILHAQDSVSTGPYDTLRFSNTLSKVTVLNGGFPYNFTRDTELEDCNQMLLTRALMITGIKIATEQFNVIPNENILSFPFETQWKLISKWRSLPVHK